MESIGQSITELATRAGVSDATVTRFCGALSLRSYPEFRKSLISAIGSEKSDAWEYPTRTQDSETLTTTGDRGVAQSRRLAQVDPRSFEEIVASVAKANNVIVAGLGQAAFLCEFLVGHFAAHFPYVVSVGLAGAFVAGTQIRACAKGDALILLSNFDCDSQEDMLVQMAEERGLTVICAHRIEERNTVHKALRSNRGGGDRPYHFQASLNAAEKVHSVLVAVTNRKDRPVHN